MIIKNVVPHILKITILAVETKELAIKIIYPSDENGELRTMQAKLRALKWFT